MLRRERSGLVTSGPIIIIAIVAIPAREIQFPILVESPCLSFAPKLWLMTIPAPVAIPTNIARRRLRIGIALPTAESALSPT